MNMCIDAFTSSTFTATLSAIKVYLFWNTVHWSSILFYQEFCAPKSRMGFLMTPFMTQTPHCRTAHWIHRTSTDAFNNIGALMVTWSTSFITKWFSVTNKKAV